ncbi:hypothetical protein [Niabella beijingensis]|uniref:hypothetical protein n=1 Tax=Niabella beijingensis TaxID=2872700 RepID=UPI001CC156B1|nr:hypothetical protein [Niabella beijingensis]MBZ4188339.1 hypothetical protein [Niabella beijingensis]
MKFLIPLVSFLFTQYHALGQESHMVFKNEKDSSQNFYIVRPPRSAIKGLLVLNDRTLSDSAKRKAFEAGILIMTVVPAANALDNLTGDSVAGTY